VRKAGAREGGEATRRATRRGEERELARRVATAREGDWSVRRETEGR